MTLQEFENKHDEKEYLRPINADHVLMRIASNLSDLHIEIEWFDTDQIDNKLNALKEYIFDYQRVLHEQNKHKVETEREKAKRLLEEVKDAISQLEELGPNYAVWQNAQASHKILKKANKDLRFVG